MWIEDEAAILHASKTTKSDIKLSTVLSSYSLAITINYDYCMIKPVEVCLVGCSAA